MEGEIHRKMLRVGGGEAKGAGAKGIDIFCLDSEAEGEAILCLHGRWGRGEVWVPFMRRYGNRFRVLAPDQRGHGLSDKPDSSYSTEEMAGDMVGLLDGLGVERAIVVGHSMGGAIAAYLAAKYPDRVRALAILDKSASGPARHAARPASEIEAAEPIAAGWPLPFASRLEAEAYMRGALGSGLSYEYFRNSLVEEVAGYRLRYADRAMAANIANYEEWFDLLPAIECPVTLMRSSSHEAVPDVDWERMKSLIPGCLAFEMSHPDHNVQLANPDEFYGYFEEFLKKIGLSSNIQSRERRVMH